MVILSYLSIFLSGQQTKLTTSLTSSLKLNNNSKEFLNPTSADNFDLVLTHKLYKLKNNIDLVNHSKIVDNFISKPTQVSTSFNNLVIMSSLGNAYNSKASLHLLNKPGYNLKDTILKDSLDLNYYISNANLLNSNINGGVEGLTISTLNLSNNLDLAKQSRWLLKNSPVSRNTSTNNFSITESKKLIGDSLSLPNMSSVNI
jgi:hypothetical protein